MALAIDREPEMVRHIKVEVGAQSHAVDFGRPIHHAEAMRRLREILRTFDREEELPL